MIPRARIELGREALLHCVSPLTRAAGFSLAARQCQRRKGAFAGTLLVCFIALSKSQATAGDGEQPVRVFTGTVVDEAGAPIPDALVEWGHFQARQADREFTVTNAAGEYRLETTRAWQDFRLGVHKPGYGPRWMDGLIPARDGAVVDFTLPHSKTVTGVVVYPSGEPMPGVCVVAQPGRYEVRQDNLRLSLEPGPFPGPLRVATTNEQGEFIIRDVSEVLVLNKETGVTEVRTENVELRFNGNHHWSFGEQVLIGVPGQFEVFSNRWLATPETAGVASAHVVDASTLRPITAFQSRWKPHPDVTEFVSADGQFTLSEVFLQGDEVEIEVFAEGYAPASANVIAVGASEKSSAMIRLTPHAPLECEVVDAVSGAPLPGVEIHAGINRFEGSLREAEWNILRQFHVQPMLIQQQRVSTNAQGQATFLEGETANNLLVLHPGYAREIILPVDRETLMTENKVLRIELKPEARISGRILLPPIPGAQFRVGIGRPSNSDTPFNQYPKEVSEHFGEGELNEAGEFSFDCLSGGTYHVAVLLNNGPTRAYWRTEVKVMDGEQAFIEIGAPAGPHALTGIAPPFSNLQLRQFFPEGPLMFAAYADADGRFEITGLPEGIYEVDIAEYLPSQGINRSRNDFVEITGDTERDFTAVPLLDGE